VGGCLRIVAARKRLCSVEKRDLHQITRCQLVTGLFFFLILDSDPGSSTLPFQTSILFTYSRLPDTSDSPI
jgi:hypothetical protein